MYPLTVAVVQISRMMSTTADTKPGKISVNPKPAETIQAQWNDPTLHKYFKLANI